MFFRLFLLLFGWFCVVWGFFSTETYSLFSFHSQSLPVFELTTGDQAVQRSINLTLVLMSFFYFPLSTSLTLL